jgi:CBS domain-containing protein
MNESSASTQPEGGRTATVAQLMRPAVMTTVERHAHLAAAAYLMRHAGDSAVVVTADDESRRPIGIITEADITRTVADGKDPNDVRIESLIGRDPVTVQPSTTVGEAANVMISAHIQHLPVVEDGRLVGILGVLDACRALLDVT